MQPRQVRTCRPSSGSARKEKRKGKRGGATGPRDGVAVAAAAVPDASCTRAAAPVEPPALFTPASTPVRRATRRCKPGRQMLAFVAGSEKLPRRCETYMAGVNTPPAANVMRMRRTSSRRASAEAPVKYSGSLLVPWPPFLLFPSARAAQTARQRGLAAFRPRRCNAHASRTQTSCYRLSGPPWRTHPPLPPSPLLFFPPHAVVAGEIERAPLAPC